MPQNNAFLGVALHVNCWLNINDMFFFLKTVDHYFHRIGDFFFVIQQYLFADDFWNKKTFRSVGQLIFLEISRTFRQQIQNPVHHRFNIEFILCGNRNNFSCRHFLLPMNHPQLNILLCRKVNFIDQQKYRHMRFCNFIQHSIFCKFQTRFRHQKKNICILKGRIDVLIHHFMHLIGRIADNTRGIWKNNLIIFTVHNPHNPVPGSLRLGGDNWQSFTYQSVHQSRLPHIGITDNIDKTCFMRHNFFEKIFAWQRNKIYLCTLVFW